MTSITKKSKPPRAYSKPEKLIALYRWIEEYRAEHGYSPSNREVAEAFPDKGGNPLSTSVVRYYYERMEEQNMIRYDRNISRGIVPLPIKEI